MPSIKFQADWELNAQFAGVIVALAEGLYEKAGLQVELLPWKSGMDVIAEVDSGKADISCSEQSLIVEAQSRGVEIVAVATMLQRSPMGLMTTSPQLRTMKDLKPDSKIGVHVDGRRMIELSKGLHGVENFDVVNVAVHDKFDRVLSGELDAVQCYVVDEPIAIQRRYGLDEEPGVLDLQITMMAQTIFVKRPFDKSTIKAFLEATFDGWRIALKNGRKAARAIHAVSPRLDVVHQTRLLAKLAPFVRGDISDDMLIGRINPSVWFANSRLLYKYNVIKKYRSDDTLYREPTKPLGWHCPVDDTTAPIVFDHTPGTPWWTTATISPPPPS